MQSYRISEAIPTVGSLKYIFIYVVGWASNLLKGAQYRYRAIYPCNNLSRHFVLKSYCKDIYKYNAWLRLPMHTFVNHFGKTHLNPLQWRHKERYSVSNHRPLLNRLFRRRSKKTSKFRVIGLREGNSPVTGEFPSHKAVETESVSIWWRHHSLKSIHGKTLFAILLSDETLIMWVSDLEKTTPTATNDIPLVPVVLFHLVASRWSSTENCDS